MEIYVVGQGDTVNSIAAEYGVTAESIIQNNQIRNPQSLVVGQALLILTGQETPLYGRAIEAGGYAYPFIQPAVLRQAAPHLNTLLNFSYGFDTEGTLLPLDDQGLLETAAEFGLTPILVLTPFTEEGTFNNQLVNLVVEDLQVQEQLIQNLLQVTSEKGYGGIDIDFEFILAEDRDAYVAFVRNVREAANPRGLTVSVALAPKVSAEQKGLLYEGIDYGGLGEAADSVLLMTYEWGYKYGPPLAVAPVPSVRRVIEYALTEIPPEKIDLGIPNYGYDWPLPFERGITEAETIGNQQALQIASEYGAQILYDESAQAPYFFYQRNGVEHEVWFEDVRSLQAKLELVEEYGFRGIGIWNLMRPFLAGWLLLSATFPID